ncbi:LacI family DNA-binding transcriptional regulator [Actinophytocola sp.]|uniref:LacI family DNA-binding transcriptional regulator n=1 Tax=Actinophytocola sp. TaxID=1872138 RepID=UPI002EDA9169
MAATIYDVATRAGVSISTVSLALNSPSRVKPATLQRILAAADELRFVPKAEAVVRARRGVRRIGVMAPFTSYLSFAQRLNGVMHALRAESWEIVVYDQESAANSIPSLASIPLTNTLDGLLVMSLPIDDESADRILRQKLTTVLLEVQRPGFSSVAIDNAEGGRLAAELFLRRGHTRFAYLAEAARVPNRVLGVGSRLDAYRDTLAAAGHALPDEHVVYVPHGIDAAKQATHALLDLADPPTAVFAYDDLLASGVLKAARERGLRVPAELSVIGFDDGDIAEHLGLTTIRQPLEESGEIAAQTLVARLTGRQRSLQHVTLKITLIERET